MNKTIAIAGLGWLGGPFARHLQTLGYQIKGSVSSLEKATRLQKYGIDAYRVEISEMGVSGDVKALLSEAACLVIMIPPGLRRNTGSDYVLKMTHFLTEINKSSVNRIIFVSSTSVYDDIQGDVTENTPPLPAGQAGKQLLQVEQLFSNSENLNVSIVRFGGLIGGSRQPARYLSGRKDLLDGNAPVNLIHRDDCIGILSEIIKQDAFGYLFNGVTPNHPTKATYYTRKALALELEPPYFAETTEEEVFKQVDSENLKKILGYEFIRELN